MSCLDKLLETYPQLSRKEGKAMEDALVEITRQSENNTIRLEKLKNFTSETSLKRAVKIKNKLDDLRKKDANIRHVLQKNFDESPIEALKSLGISTPFNVDGKYNNVDMSSTSNGNLLRGELFFKLKREGLYGFASKGKNDGAIIDAFENLKSSFAKSENKAERIAWIYAGINDKILKMQQNAGSTIGYNSTRLITQTHNPDIILSDVDAWIHDMLGDLDIKGNQLTLGMLDISESFGEGINGGMARKLLREMAQDLDSLSGGHGGLLGGKKQLFFRKGEFKKYNAKYGYNDLLTGMAGAIDVSARKAALHEKFGSNPRKAFTDLLDTLQNINPAKFAGQARKEAERMWDLITGAGNRVGEGFSSKTLDGIQIAKNLELAQVLGRSSIPALEDIATTIVKTQSIGGRNIFTTMADLLVSGIESLGKGKEEFFEDLGMFLKDMQAAQLKSWGSSVNARGKIAGNINMALQKTVDVQLHANGTHFITTGMRKWNGIQAIKEVTRIVEGKNLNRFQIQTKGAIGFKDADTALLKRILKESDRDRVTLSMLRETDVDTFVPHDRANTPENRRVYKQELERKLTSFFHSVINAGSSLPGGRQALLFRENLPINDPQRVMIGVVGQLLKTLAKVTETFEEGARAASINGSKRDLRASWAISRNLIIGGTGAYLAGMLKEYIRTGELDLDALEENAVADITKALADSGAGGLYTLYIYNMLNPYLPGVPGARLNAPIPGHLAKVIEGIVDPNEDKTRRLLYRMAPFQNYILLNDEIKSNIMEMIPLP